MLKKYSVLFLLLLQISCSNSGKPDSQRESSVKTESSTKQLNQKIEKSGELIDGVRVIHLSMATAPGKIFAYRGETVKLIIEKVDFPYSILIPKFNIDKEAEIGKDLEVSLKAKEIGVFPVFCKGNCPTGDGPEYAQLVVKQYESEGEAKYREVTIAESKELIKSVSPLVVDVRTPNEYNSGHLEGSKLIPLQQLEGRISEIENYKDKDVLVYCRSGNRSTVASQILIRNGFKKIYNMKRGIIGWQEEGEKVSQNH